jgi:hypothetical protein
MTNKTIILIVIMVLLLIGATSVISYSVGKNSLSTSFCVDVKNVNSIISLSNKLIDDVNDCRGYDLDYLLYYKEGE